MKQFLLLLAIVLTSNPGARGQLYTTQSAAAFFTVSAPAKNIEGRSDSVSLQVDFGKKEVRLEVPVGSFGFRNNFVSDSLNAMIAHRFRNYYMEAGRFPLITYSGSVDYAGKINLAQNGRYPVQTEGVLTLHGVRKKIQASGYLIVTAGSVTLQAELMVKPSDYGIRIPPYIGDMYFKEVKIQLKARLAKQTH